MPASLKHLSQLVAERQAQPDLSSASAVLAKWRHDQKYYSVEVLACDKLDRKCMVRFEDKFECWMSTDELHIQLSLDHIEDDEKLAQQIVCCVCDDGASKAPNEIVICDTCQQGYHLKCHKPELNRLETKLDDELDEWNCATCKYLLQIPDAPRATEAAVSQERKPKLKKEKKIKDEEKEDVAMTEDDEETKEVKPMVVKPKEEKPKTIPTTLESSPPPTPPPSKAKVKVKSETDDGKKEQKPTKDTKKPSVDRKPKVSSSGGVKKTKIKLTQHTKKDKEQIIPMTSHVVNLVNS